jgi:hypothetical protein
LSAVGVLSAIPALPDAAVSRIPHLSRLAMEAAWGPAIATENHPAGGHYADDGENRFCFPEHYARFPAGHPSRRS